MKLTTPQRAALEKLADGPSADINATVARNLTRSGLITQDASRARFGCYSLTELGREALGGGSETGGNFEDEQDTAVLAAEAPTTNEVTEADRMAELVAEQAFDNWADTPTIEEIGYVGKTADDERRGLQLMNGERFRIEDTDGPANPQQAAYGLAMLGGLGDSKRHVYGGTANPGRVNRRRAKNRVAAKTRKANRRG